MIDLRVKLSATDGVIRYIAKALCGSLRPFLRGFVENFCAGLNKSVDEAFRARSFSSQFHANSAIDSVTLRFSDGAASEDGDGSAKSEDVVDPSADRRIIEL